MHRTILIAVVVLSAAACTRGPTPATATLTAKSGSQVTGSATFTEKEGGLDIVVQAKYLTPGKHAVHVHEIGDCSAANASSAGGHFNPGGGSHGGPIDPHRHAGDLGNLDAGADGSGTLKIKTDALTVAPGERSVVGRAIAIHGDGDDFISQPSGNAGSIVACGVIELPN